MNVKIRLEKASQPIFISEVLNTYQKGSFYCVYTLDKKVRKFPIDHIFDIEEDY